MNGVGNLIPHIWAFLRGFSEVVSRPPADNVTTGVALPFTESWKCNNGTAWAVHVTEMAFSSALGVS